MKKKILILFLLLSIITLTACNKKNNEDAKKFKESYEELNNQDTGNNNKYREVNIDEDNPIIDSSFNEINKKIENKETFIAYIGFRKCPWCRSVIESALSSAKENNIDEIYYVDVRPTDEKSGDLRGYKKLDENNIVVTDVEKGEGYDQFIKYCDEFLDPYILTDEEGNEYSTNEDRLYAPTYIIVIKGKVVKLTEGSSDKQTDGYQELTDEIKNDMKNTFDEFFKYYNENK